MISLTGSTGFVGKNLINYLKQYKLAVRTINRDEINSINPILFDKIDIVVHLAGKAHDLKNTSNSDEYYNVNTELTKAVFNAFLSSNAKVFITLSSVKAVADGVNGELTEAYTPNPSSHYGKSKLLADQFIFSKDITLDKRVYILRPCMIHGPGNKGNLNLLYKIPSMGFPWPLGSFENKRSFCSIENLCFIIKELIVNDQIPSGIYNIADEEPLSTNELIRLISKSIGKKAKIIHFNKSIILALARIGSFLRLPFNTENLKKLTESYLVSNTKIKSALGKSLPVSSKEGLLRTFHSFSSNA
jgi:nucleoside-diphosphate-sugar epimerase